MNFLTNNGLAPIRRQAIIWTNEVLVHWRIYASFGLNVSNIPLANDAETFSDKNIQFHWKKPNSANFYYKVTNTDGLPFPITF